MGIDELEQEINSLKSDIELEKDRQVMLEELVESITHGIPLDEDQQELLRYLGISPEDYIKDYTEGCTDELE